MKEFDEPIQKIASYAAGEINVQEDVLETASLCLMDALSCGIKALGFKEAVNILGPYYEGDSSAFGARIPGTNFQLSPPLAAFQIGSMIRWLDYNDTFLGKE